MVMIKDRNNGALCDIHEYPKLSLCASGGTGVRVKLGKVVRAVGCRNRVPSYLVCARTGKCERPREMLVARSPVATSPMIRRLTRAAAASATFPQPPAAAAAASSSHRHKRPTAIAATASTAAAAAALTAAHPPGARFRHGAAYSPSQHTRTRPHRASTWDHPAMDGDPGRGLHSSTFQLNLSALYGIGGVRRGCVARVHGVLGGV